ncbi:MAG TPA: sigma-70 family RNA polymerase sigma factor, partial [Microlunatus sp.]|nr:sigma-70 family RNA polymerase sigma factor [Microlunatus sp.]
HRRARGRRPSESLEEFLPRFDADGVHAGTPEELKLASRADELIDQKLLAERARSVLAQLPDMYRDPFVLRDLEGMSTAEVGETLGLDPAAVRQRVHRARLMLRGYLSDLVGVKP